MRLLPSDMSCWYMSVGGYKGMPDSDSITNFWFKGLAIAALNSCRAASIRACVPQLA